MTEANCSDCGHEATDHGFRWREYFDDPARSGSCWHGFYTPDKGPDMKIPLTDMECKCEGFRFENDGIERKQKRPPLDWRKYLRP
jgi:hypothetical protein